MKNTFYLFFILIDLLFGVTFELVAQPAQRLINVVVSPDHTNWKYKCKEEVTFTIQVFKDENLLENATIDYEIGPECFPVEKKLNVVLKKGKTTLNASLKEPGFLRCRVLAKVDGRQYEGLATVAVEEESIKPFTSQPGDFENFWTQTLEEVRKLPLDPKMILLPERCTETQNVYHVSFQNHIPCSRIYGILIVPKKKGRYPAVLQVPGAGIRSYKGLNLGDNIITLEIGIHGIPVDLPQGIYTDLSSGPLSWYHEINKHDRNGYYYKRVFVGCVKAVDFIYSLPEFDGSTIGVTGGSQGGALSIVTAALDSRIKFLAALYPALCDHAGYLNGRAGGWPHYFRKTPAKANEMETLAYFDVVNFARRIKVDGWYSWGFNDQTCPPTSMYAAYNVIPGNKELHLYLRTGHWTFPEQEKARLEWLKRKCKCK